MSASDALAVLRGAGPLGFALIIVGMLALLQASAFIAFVKWVATNMVTVEVYKDSKVAAERLCSVQHCELDEKVGSIHTAVQTLLDRGVRP